MIFVTVGTWEAPFDRLLRALDDVGQRESIVVQGGRSEIRPRDATFHEFLPFDSVVDHIRRARVVVSHAGAGSVLLALANSKLPMVVPRLARFGEVVDDHQVPFATRLADAGLVEVIHDIATLPALLTRDEQRQELRQRGFETELTRDLRDYIGLYAPHARDRRRMSVRRPMRRSVR